MEIFWCKALTYTTNMIVIFFALSAFYLRARVLLFFFFASRGKTHSSRTVIRMQRCSLDTLSFRAHLDVLALRTALVASLWLPEIELAL